MKIKLTLDIILLLLFGAMCNTAATGTPIHEIGGIVYAALIGAHLLLNRKWLAAAFKGKLRGKRSVVMSAVNAALLADLVVILATGIRASHYLFPAAVKAPTVVIVTHAVCGVIAALLVLTHVLLHIKAITKGKFIPKVGLAAVLTIVISYSLYGGVQGALHHGLPKDSGEKGQYEQHDSGESHRKPKDGERK